MSKILEYIRLFVSPGQVTEIRAFADTGTYAGVFDYDHLPELARAAQELSHCKGVYFLPNPIGLPATNQIRPAGRCATDADVTRRRWVLIDVDPTRPSGSNATDAERQAAWRVLTLVQGVLEAGGWRAPVVASSGNGWHLCYPVDMPNDDTSRAAVKDLLAGLHERCSSAGAKVDIRTYNASRIWKLYGTHARKGSATEDRPHRLAWVTQSAAMTEDDHATNTRALPAVLQAWRIQADALAALEAQRATSQFTPALRRAEAYLAKTPPAVSGQGGHNATFHAAMVAVEGFDLSEADALQVLSIWNARCSPPWSDRELTHKIQDAAKLATNRGHLLVTTPTPAVVAKSIPAGRVAYTGPEQVEDRHTSPEDTDATAVDLIALQAQVRWAWTGWIQQGTITALASDPGVGKTRFCADLLRRIYLGLPWPDGSPATFPVGTRAIWIAADSQWAELATIPAEFGFAPEAIVLNGWRSNPYAGTNLDTVEDLAELERRIRRVQPGLVLVDTAGNATDRNTTRPEEAKQFFKPLAEIANRTGASVVLVTHLNKGGEALGRRIVGACRQVLKLEAPDPLQPNRRRLWVDKTNSKRPDALGVTMTDAGNEYDTSPPTAGGAADEPGRGSATPATRGRPSNLTADVAWLMDHISTGAKQVRDVIQSAEVAGISIDRLYRARRASEITQTERDGRKWWEMTA